MLKCLFQKNYHHHYPTDCIKALYLLIKLKAIILALNILTSKYTIPAESKTELKIENKIKREREKLYRNLQNEFSNGMLMGEF